MPNIVFVGLALAMDAFGVSMGLGCGNKLILKQKIAIVISFGFFQFFLAWLGAELGHFINSNIFNISNKISGLIILFIGFLLLKDGYENDDDCSYVSFSFITYIIMGISVSMDALGVGFSLLFKLTELHLLFNSLIIGLITILMTIISLIVVRFIKHFSIVEAYADYLGGVILVFFGLNMIL